MQQAGLDLHQAPPISVPFRFFLTAPVFALLAALVMLWHGADVFASRWSPATLAVTHLLTLGFMTMVMAGAMMQMLPVLAGAPVPRSRLVAAIVHSALVLGTLSLAGGFLSGQALLLKSAVGLLGVGLAVFVGAMLVTFSRVRNFDVTVIAMALAVGALGVTIVFALLLGAMHAWGIVLPSMALRDLHPGWGLIGWTGLLVVGVAYQIVPMFQMTPDYPSWLSRGFAGVVCAALVLLTLAQWGGTEEWRLLSLACIGAIAAAYIVVAGITLDLQRRRRRRLPDVTLAFWRVGMICVILAALLWVSQRFPALVFARAEVLLGILVIAGAAGSFIGGMLCKIGPFLVWFHLQSVVVAGAKPPNMKAMLPEKLQRLQLRLYVAALLLLAGAALWPAVFAYPAVLVFGAAALSLLWNMVCVTRVYRDFTKRGVVVGRMK